MEYIQLYFEAQSKPEYHAAGARLLKRVTLGMYIVMYILSLHDLSVLTVSYTYPCLIVFWGFGK